MADEDKYTAARFPVMDVVSKHHPPESHSRAIENYPQFCRAAQVVRLQEDSMGRSSNQDRDRDIDRAEGKQPSDLLGLRLQDIRLRPAIAAPVRVCAAVANQGLFRLRNATSRLSKVRCEGGKGSLVRWQEPIDNDLPLVPSGLGQATFLERGCRRVRHNLAECVSLGKTGGFMGIGASEIGKHRVDRRRRSAVAKRSQVSDVGLSDRFGRQAVVMDRQGSHDQDLPAVLPDARQRTQWQTEVRLQRHVEAILESDCQEGSPGDSRARPISHYAKDATCK